MIPTAILEKILKDIDNIRGVKASAIATRDGSVIYTTIPEKTQADKFVAMSAAMIGAAEIATRELWNGILERIIVESKAGKIIGIGAGSKALLLAMIQSDASLGLVLIDMAKASEKIKEVLG